MKNLINPQILLTVLNSKKNNTGADFTLKSLKTSKEYTFKIIRKEYKNTWYSHIKVETEYQNYLYLGYFFNGNLILKGKINYSNASLAISWALRHIETSKFDVLNNNVEFYHLGHCLKCGKLLTDTISINLGLGPICKK